MPDTADSKENNGRVTMAILSTKLDNVIDNQKRLMTKQETLENAFHEHCKQSTRRDTMIDDNSKEIEKLRNKSDRNDVISTVAGIISGTISGIVAGLTK